MRSIYFAALFLCLPAVHAQDFAPVRNLLDKAVADGVVAGGSVLVLHRGEVVLGEGFGYADLKTRVPFELETPAIIASISKPLLGTAAFRMAERGELDLAVPISQYLPEFEDRELESGDAVGRAPKMIELLTHTSGLRNDEALLGRPWFASWTRGRPLSVVVERYARDFPFKAQPGSRYAYSGIGIDVAARVLEVAGKRSRNELLVAEVSDPLGMKSTRFRDAESIKQFGNMPTRYYRSRKGNLLPSRKRRLPAQGDYSASGGTVISNAPDLARWLLMVRDGGRHEDEMYLPGDSVAEMLTGISHSKNARCGFFIRKRNAQRKALVVGHTGSSGTNCWIDFENDIIGVMLTQTTAKQIRAFRIELQKRVTECVREADQSRAKSK